MLSDRDAEIVRRVRAGYDAFNRGDFDEAAAMMHPDVEYVPVGGQAPGPRARGPARLDGAERLDEQFIEPLEITVAGSKILMRSRTKARGAGSGIEMEVKSWVVMTVDDDLLVTRLETFFPHEEETGKEQRGTRRRVG